jgi:hypothetical protein
MLEFYSKEEFYEWLPIDTKKFLDYIGETKDSFYDNYKNGNGYVELDKEDVADIMYFLWDYRLKNRVVI